MSTRVKSLELDGTPHVGRIKEMGVAVYTAAVASEGRHRFRSRARIILIVELRDVDGNVLARKGGRRDELVGGLTKGRCFISLSGATRRIAGQFALTGEPA